MAQRGAMGAQKGCQGMGEGQKLQSPGGSAACTAPTPPLQDPETPAFLSTLRREGVGSPTEGGARGHHDGWPSPALPLRVAVGGGEKEEE